MLFMVSVFTRVLDRISDTMDFLIIKSKMPAVVLFSLLLLVSTALYFYVSPFFALCQGSFGVLLLAQLLLGTFSKENIQLRAEYKRLLEEDV